MVLSKGDILSRCEELAEKDALISNFRYENIQTCSYDLRMGGQYYYHKKAYGDSVKVSTLKEGEVLNIPPHAICYVMTEETVNIPADLTASISLAFGLINRGIMLAAQPPYDPGYKGKTVALLHNLSNRDVQIKRGQHILNMVFTKLNSDVSAEQKYKGKYQGLDDLNDYCKEKRVGAIFELNQKLEKTRDRFNNFLPNILTVITVVIAVLTVLFSVLIGIQSGRSLFQSDSSKDDALVHTTYPEFSVDKERNTLIICIDDQYYEVKLNTETLSSNEVLNH